MRFRFLCLTLVPILLAGCAQPSNPVTGPPIGPAPVLSWAANWVAGTQQAPITFQEAGQTATLTINTPGGSQGPPYGISSGSCVTLSSHTATTPRGSVDVTATASGSCTIAVEGLIASESTIQVIVP